MESSNNYKNNRQFPGIGMRIIKSAIGIFLCFLIDYFRHGSGIVFYSQLAVLWCIRDYMSETKKFAIQRTVGTIIGAVYGLFLIVGKEFINNIYDADILSGKLFSTVNSSIGYGLIVSLVIILVLYTTVLIGQKQASYFSCVVFLSIVINHVADINPYIFVWNRFLDTMIGIAVGVFVNCFTIHSKKNKDILFLSGLDDTLLNHGGEISAYSRVELNRMIESGVKFTVSTIRTPASLLEPLRGVNLSLPVIAMDGAALYNIADNSYEKVYVISKEHSVMVQEYLTNLGWDYFTNVIMEDVLLIYYKKSVNEYYNKLIQRMRKSPYRNYLKEDNIVDQSVVYFMVIDCYENIMKLKNILECEERFNIFKITITPDDLAEGSLMLKIYSKNASKENMLDYLKQKLDISDTVTFGTIEGKYTYTIGEGEFNNVVKIMKKEINA